MYSSRYGVGGISVNTKPVGGSSVNKIVGSGSSVILKVFGGNPVICRKNYYSFIQTTRGVGAPSARSRHGY